jgi:dolichol kinase
VLPHAIGLNLGWVFLVFGWCLVYIILEPTDVAIATVAFIAGGSSCKALCGGTSLASAPWASPAGAKCSPSRVLSLVLCVVVLSVAISEKISTPELFGLAIGSCRTSAASPSVASRTASWTGQCPRALPLRT